MGYKEHSFTRRCLCVVNTNMQCLPYTGSAVFCTYKPDPISVTTWNSVLLQELTVGHLAKILPFCYETRKVINRGQNSPSLEPTLSHTKSLHSIAR